MDVNGCRIKMVNKIKLNNEIMISNKRKLYEHILQNS